MDKTALVYLMFTIRIYYDIVSTHVGMKMAARHCIAWLR